MNLCIKLITEIIAHDISATQVWASSILFFLTAVLLTYQQLRWHSVVLYHIHNTLCENRLNGSNDETDKHTNRNNKVM